MERGGGGEGEGEEEGKGEGEGEGEGEGGEGGQRKRERGKVVRGRRIDPTTCPHVCLGCVPGTSSISEMTPVQLLCSGKLTVTSIPFLFNA